jgi:hypothetical protein
LPAASRAVNVTTVVPEGTGKPVVQLLVPTTLPLAPPSVVHVMSAMPMLSVAVPAMVKFDADVVIELAVVGT